MTETKMQVAVILWHRDELGGIVDEDELKRLYLDNLKREAQIRKISLVKQFQRFLQNELEQIPKPRFKKKKITLDEAEQIAMGAFNRLGIYGATVSAGLKSQSRAIETAKKIVNARTIE